MKRTLALWVEKDVVWEFDLGVAASLIDKDELLSKIPELEWGDITRDAEVEGWREMRMEIREY